MSDPLITRVLRGPGLLVTRSREGLRRKPRVAYVGAARSHNVGDAAMFDLVQSLVPSVHWIPAEAAVWERRLSTLGLSGHAYFSLAVLGGGTMMNAYSEAVVRCLLDRGVRLVSLGTGAGSGGWDLPPGYDLANWVPLLRRFEWVTVRGPRTLHALEDAGFSKATVVGDLGLAFTRSDPAGPSERPRRLFYNLIERGPHETWNQAVIEALGSALSRRAREGWEVVPFAMQPSDAQACEVFARRHGLAPRVPVRPTSGQDLVERLEAASLVVSMRLHGAVFASAAGTPTVSIGYRSKCDDFMESLGAGKALLPVDASGGVEALVDDLEQRMAWAAECVGEIHRRALVLADEIRRRAGCVGTLAARRQR